MDKRDVLQQAISEVLNICEKIKGKQSYYQDMPGCVAAVQNASILLLQDKNREGKVLQLLEDMMYGMTQKDDVFLLDVLRFGLKTEFELALHEIDND